MRTEKKKQKPVKQKKKDGALPATPREEQVSAKDHKKVMEQLRALGYL